MDIIEFLVIKKINKQTKMRKNNNNTENIKNHFKKQERQKRGDYDRTEQGIKRVHNRIASLISLDSQHKYKWIIIVRE